MAKKEVNILRLRLAAPTLIGNGGTVYEYIGADEDVDGKSIKILFDDDPRFIRIEGNKFVDLIPIYNLKGIKIA
jgi:hypothetical protein